MYAVAIKTQTTLVRQIISSWLTDDLYLGKVSCWRSCSLQVLKNRFVWFISQYLPGISKLSLLLSSFLFCFQGHRCSIWRFPVQGWNWSYSCRPTPEPQQHGIRDMSVTYTTAHGNTKSLTHWVRPGDWTQVLMDASQVRQVLSHDGNSYLYFHFSLGIFFFLIPCHTCSIWKFPGHYTVAKPNPLTHCARLRKQTRAYTATQAAAVGFLTHCAMVGTPGNLVF